MRSRAALVAILVVAVAVSLVVVDAPSAQAQAPDELVQTCIAYRRVVGTGGQSAADAAAELRQLSANPFGVNNALDVYINTEADVPPLGSRPTNDAFQQAIVILTDHFGPDCQNLDVCPFIRQAVTGNDAATARAAAIARDLVTPGPAGILVALDYIAGDLDESPFHANTAEAQAQVAGYFPCELDDSGPVPGPPPGVPVDVAATCGDLAVLSIPEGPFAIEAAESLRARGAPNPAGIEEALDVIVAAADFSNATPPAFGDVDAALLTLDGYFGGACSGIDRCAFVTQIGVGSAASGAEAARLLRRIETPSPPGIDAALALIAGDIDESPFHASVGEARDQVLSYYPCSVAGDSDGGAAGDDGGLAFTGSLATAPLAAFGLGLLAAGAGVLRVRRRITGEQ